MIDYCYLRALIRLLCSHTHVECVLLKFGRERRATRKSRLFICQHPIEYSASYMRKYVCVIVYYHVFIYLKTFPIHIHRMLCKFFTVPTYNSFVHNLTSLLYSTCVGGENRNLPPSILCMCTYIKIALYREHSHTLAFICSGLRPTKNIECLQYSCGVQRQWSRQITKSTVA